jgi:hypothetical protein
MRFGIDPRLRAVSPSSAVASRVSAAPPRFPHQFLAREVLPTFVYGDVRDQIAA